MIFKVNILIDVIIDKWFFLVIFLKLMHNRSVTIGVTGISMSDITVI